MLRVRACMFMRVCPSVCMCVIHKSSPDTEQVRYLRLSAKGQGHETLEYFSIYCN